MNANDTAAIRWMLETKALRLVSGAEQLRGLIAMLGWLTVDGRIDVRSARDSLRDCVRALDEMIDESQRGDPLAEVPFETGVNV